MKGLEAAVCMFQFRAKYVCNGPRQTPCKLDGSIFERSGTYLSSLMTAHETMMPRLLLLVVPAGSDDCCCVASRAASQALAALD
jgi:hypothetical protein